MPSKTLTANRSSLLATTAPSGGSNLGGGQDIHLPISKSGGYQLRGLVGFTFPAGFWDDVKTLTKAELLLTGSSVVHVGRGASPTAYVYRNVSEWTANAAGESWTTAPTVYPGPSATGADGVAGGLPHTTEQVAVDITLLVLAWAPSAVKGPGGKLGGNAANYGLGLWESGGAAQAAEIWSAAYGTAAARPTLRLTYDSNSPPGSPTLIRPLGPDQLADRFDFSTIDAEGDAVTAYDIQVSTDPSFATVTAWDLVGGTSGITGGGAAAAKISRVYGGTPLVNTTRYYWRARARDAGGYGAWSSSGTFVKGTGPAVLDAYDLWAQTILEDMAAGRIAIRLGPLRPYGEQVAQLVAADYRDRFDLYLDDVSPIVDRTVIMLGQRVSLSADGWSVDAVVELEPET